METASDIINDALQELLVQGSEQSVQSVDFQTGVRYLNRMMTSFAAQGINLGYTVVSKASDIVTVPDGALEGVVFNLAKRLATSYDVPISPSLELNAQEGKEAMRALAFENIASVYPDTLPIGSGNEGDSTFENFHFYAGASDNVLDEQGNSIQLEENTSNE